MERGNIMIREYKAEEFIIDSEIKEILKSSVDLAKDESYVESLI